LGTFAPDTHLFSQQDISTKTDSYKKGGQEFSAATKEDRKNENWREWKWWRIILPHCYTSVT